MELTERSWRNVEAARGLVRPAGRAIVAFSGGVDSTVLVVLAQETLGADRVLAVTADSASIARQDLDDAVRLARRLGLRHEVIRTQEVEQTAYRRNALDRCYHCKDELFTRLEQVGRARGYAAILYGAIGDDLREERPGQRAAAAHGAQAPLQDAGLEKWEVRLVARAWGLPNWNKPQNACLSSRIPHGADVTEEKLRQIELAEAFLLSEGFQQVRVRHLGLHARIEVDLSDLARFDDASFSAQVADFLQALGFKSVGVDEAGYRSGGADNSQCQERQLSSKLNILNFEP